MNPTPTGTAASGSKVMICRESTGMSWVTGVAREVIHVAGLACRDLACADVGKVAWLPTTVQIDGVSEANATASLEVALAVKAWIAG